MGNLIHLALRQKSIDTNTEPCTQCDEYEACKKEKRETCDKANIWWGNFATQFKGKSDE